MQKYKQDDYEASKVHTITVYNEAGDIVKTYSGPYMNIENKNNIIYFTCNNTNMSFAVESSSNKDSENYTVVVDDNTAKGLCLEQNDTGSPVISDTGSAKLYDEIIDYTNKNKDLYKDYATTTPPINYSGSAVDLK